MKFCYVLIYLFLLQLGHQSFDLTTPLLFGNFCLKTSKIRESSFFLTSLYFLCPCSFVPLSVNIISSVLFTDGSTPCTMWNLNSDICDVEILESEHLTRNTVYRVFTQSTAVINNISDHNQFTSVLSIGNKDDTTGMDESFVNHLDCSLVVN